MLRNELMKSNSPLKSIDGWRAVSITFVLIQHSVSKFGFPAYFKNQMMTAIGGVGVRFFFVISGFLITWLLIKEVRKSNTISLKNFYFRRFFRIIPVFLLFVFVCYLLNIFLFKNNSNYDFLKTILFMGDIYNLNSPFSHLWSLGVEEKYYLIWPILFYIFYKSDFNLLIKILIISLICEPLLRFLINYFNLINYSIFNYHSFLTIFDGLAIGSLGAIIFYKNIFFKFYKKYSFIVYFIISIILILLPIVFWKFTYLKFLQPLQDSIQCSGFLIILIMSIIRPDFIFFKCLNTTIFKHLGKISYSIYIWMGIIEMFNFDFYFCNLHFTDFPVWILVLIIISEISYYLIEKPLILNRNKIISLIELKFKQFNNNIKF
jgi:peptidoglycan/LPS O-acetylase OafA/YrhL